MKKTLLLGLLVMIISTAWTQTYTYTVSTVAGAKAGPAKDSSLAESRFKNPTRIAIDASGNLIVADRNNHRIRKIDLVNDTVTTIAGSTKGFLDDTDPLSAQFNNPSGVAIDAAGNIYVADKLNQRIRMIDANTLAVTTMAGDGTAGLADGPAATAQFNNPIDIVINAAGDLFVADELNHCIRKISNGVVSTFAGSGTAGFADGDGASAQFKNPSGLAIDNSGNIIVGDRKNYRVRKIDITTQEVTTVAGSGTKGLADDVVADAEFTDPYGLAVSPTNGDIYVSQYTGPEIRRISNGEVVTIAGDGDKGYIDGDGSIAKFYAPTGLVFDADNNIYVADANNSKIRKITITISMPVELISFGAKVQNNVVQLKWATASESGNSYFEVLRSADGSDFSAIGTVQGNGNSAVNNIYTYTDHNPLTGNIYYQLRQVDFDGNSKLSNIVAVRRSLKQAELKVYASVAKGEVKIFVYSESGGKAHLKISNMQGNTIAVKDITLEKGHGVLQLVLPLKTGMYIANLKNGTENMITKFVAE